MVLQVRRESFLRYLSFLPVKFLLTGIDCSLLQASGRPDACL
jgi:hypothetical protein